uniref:SPRY domain-containing protein n=1 Tax=Meloidogyne hapla TaxID=6305 RepID=A0A1I8BHW9_MELHA
MLIKLNEEKDKIDTLEVKNQSLEKGMKILKEELKEKITSLEKKNGDLIIELENLNKLNNKQVCFLHVANNWKEIESKIGHKCCENKCINTNKPVGNCIEGNGFINLIDGENIKYIKGKVDKEALIYTESHFNKPKEFSINYSLFYFEIKCKIEGEKNLMHIGLNNCNNKYIRYFVEYTVIKNEKNEFFKLSTFSWNDNDIFGCGLVYPPTNKKNELPYVFFTQNGKQIGKAVLSKDNCDVYKPYVVLKHCSVEANFGNDLKVKPFSYDISKHEIQHIKFNHSNEIEEIKRNFQQIFDEKIKEMKNQSLENGMKIMKEEMKEVGI